MHDTFSYVKKLREAQVPTEQAEAHIDVLSLAISRLATKDDLERGLEKLQLEFEGRFLKIEKEIQKLRLQVDRMRFGFVIILFATQVDIVDFVRMILSRL